MSKPDLWTRLRQARIVQVLLVYLGVSWGILQAVDVLQNMLPLPQWVGPVAVILLLIGMMIILATAWVQSLPSTDAREKAGEVPSDWEIAPRELGRSLAAGKLPHLNWGRAILGGVVALSLLFGASGLFVLTQGNQRGFGPPEAGASAAAEGIAVVPFDVRGSDLEIWREGMMDLLTNNLDGVGGYRTIDSRTVMARWRRTVGEESAPDLNLALRAAGATGARYALSGSVVGLGSSVRLVANVYDLATGKEIAQGNAEGPSDEVLSLADDLAVETMRALLQATGREGGDITAETMTTSSLPALRAFLEGESHYRRGEFAEAVQGYERAVAADSTFAIALIRLSEGYGWLESVNSERMQEVGEMAMAQVDRLSPRYQFVMEAWDALNHGNASGVEVLLEAVQKYPDDPEAWFLLAETYIHIEDGTYSDSDAIVDALDRAVALDPDFAPYLIHVIEEAVIRGELDRAREAMARYENLTGHTRGLEHVDYAIQIYYGTDEEAREAAERLRLEDPQVTPILHGTFGTKMDQFDRTALLDPAIEAATGANRDPFRVFTATSFGAMDAVDRYLDSLSISGANVGIEFGHANELWGWVPEGKMASRFVPDTCDDPSFNATCHLFMGAAFAREEMWDRHQETLDRIRDRTVSLQTDDPDADVEFLDGVAQFLTGYKLLIQGDYRGARQALWDLRIRSDLVGGRARLALGEMEQAQGRVEEAIRHFRSSQRGFQRPRAVLELARLSETAGRLDEARKFWNRFLTITRSGDQDLPQVVEAKEALERLAQQSL
jgi:tetratricopeptide (TPR) repeat protein